MEDLRCARCRFTPDAAVRAVPARVLLSCLPSRSSWLTVEGDRHFGAAGVLHRRGVQAAVAVRVGVAPSVPEEQRRMARSGQSRLLQVARSGSGADDGPGCCLAHKREPGGWHGGVSLAL